MYSIKKFEFTKNKTAWNVFIKNNSEGHFFFETDYLFYHKERFEDFSLLIYNQKNELICVLPACFEKIEEEKIGEEKNIFSHKGLTFGGFVFKDKLSFLEKRKCVLDCLHFLEKYNFKYLIIKPIPSFFLMDKNEAIHRILNDNLLESTILRVEANCVIDLPTSKTDYQNTTYQNYSKRKKRNLKKASQANLEIEKIKIATDFWKIIEQNLRCRHNLLPVHSAIEIQLLHDKFSQNIHFLIVKNSKNDIIACSVVFIYQSTIHLQYLAATKKGKETNALDFLINYLVENHSVFFNKSTPSKGFEYLSLGVSDLRNTNEIRDNNSINEGLFKWKEEFGAKVFSHFVYQIAL